MKKFVYAAMTVAAIASATSANAQFSISAMSTFSPNGDGWWAPAEAGYAFNTTGTTERGLAYGNGELYLASRAVGQNIRRLNGITGVEVGNLNMTGISVGTFPINKVAVGTDGVIYGANMVTSANAAGSAFRVYSWATAASTQVTNYSGAPINAVRIGDGALGVIGSGSSTVLVSGFANTFSTNTGYATISPSSSTATVVGFVGTPPAAGDFRLGLTIGPGGQVWGNQGSLALRESSFSGSAGTLLGTASGLISVAERPMAFATVNGLNILATISTGDSFVRVYDASNPLLLTLLGSKNNTTGALTANGNGTGDVAWGAMTDNGDGTTTAQLYTLSTSQGIQAFNVLVPEPATGALLGLGISALVALRRSRK